MMERFKKLLGNDQRTALMRKNIAASFLVKAWSGLVTFIIVRATLECIGEYKNGIWLTIGSMLVWIENFDIGLGNGLRNQLAASLASGDLRSAREAVSSTFFMLILIMVPAAILLVYAAHQIDLYQLLHVDRSIVNDLTKVVVVAIIMVCTTFSCNSFASSSCTTLHTAPFLPWHSLPRCRRLSSIWSPM